VITLPDQPEQRIRELEAELAREREVSEAARRRLAAKEREIVEIHRSRAWGLLSSLRSLKHRYVDPLLGLFGVVWPRRRVVMEASTRELSAARDESAGRAAGDPPAMREQSATRDEPALPEQARGPREQRAVPLAQRSIPPAGADVYDVVCFSTCDWDSRFQRPQQLMSLVAAAGHRVFYVSQLFRREGPPWAITAKRDNVYEVTFRGEELNVYANRLGERACGPLFEALAALRRDTCIGAAAVVVQLPFWWPLARRAREEFGWPVIYDCMDLHSGFATVRQAMAGEEDQLLAEADVVVASSAALERRALQKRSDVLMLRNACDFEHFAKASRARNARPVIGYYGAIADWFDSRLVAKLAARRPDWDFILIGSTYGGDLSRLVRLPNVSLPGEEPYESLPEWLGRFDAAIVPFKRTPLTEATNPVKVYEMLAAGKPVVSVPIPEVVAMGGLVRLASTAEEFDRQLTAALAEEPRAADARRAFARDHTWEQRVELLAEVMDKVVKRGLRGRTED